MLQAWGLLKYHVVDDPHYRGNALVLQTPRNTTVLVERATRIEWVVDMWPRGYPQPPDVMTVKKWVRTGAFCADSNAQEWCPLLPNGFCF